MARKPPKMQQQASQENPLKHYAWLLGAVGSVLASFVISTARSPSDKIEKLEDRTNKLELAQVAVTGDVKALKDTLGELKTAITLSNSKLDDLKSELIGMRSQNNGRK